MEFSHAKFEAFMKDNNIKGVDDSTNNNIVISLTSYPARMHELHYCIYSLLSQTIKPQKLILWLGVEEFPSRELDLPDQLLDLRDKGLEVKWTKDIKQYKKLIPALESFGDSIIVTADDDIFYPPNWLEHLYTDYINNNCQRMVYAHRAHRIRFDEEGYLLGYNSWKPAVDNLPGSSYLNFGTSGGGILFPPGVLKHEVINEKFSELAPFADDIFFWAMAVLNDTPTRVVENCIPEIVSINGYNNKHALWNINNKGMNDLQLNNIFNHYPDVRIKIQAEHLVEIKKMQRMKEEQKKLESAEYWESRYQNGSNSGAGSYNHLKDFKSEVINSFMDEHQIQSVIDFGAGDGNQLSCLNVKNYFGFEVSRCILEKLQSTFSNDADKSFFHISEYSEHRAELGLSLDVIYHLLEDDVFHTYMERLFESSTKYVIIYSSNREDQPQHKQAEHVKHRKFTKWINTHQKNWKCIQFIKNRYPFTNPNDDPTSCSFSDFYIFEKQSA